MTEIAATSVAAPIVREFREILLWPLQLERLQDGRQIQKHWELLQSLPGGSAWSEVEDEFTGDPKQFQERHYHEFVTFLPAVQRFLYGEGPHKAAHARPVESSLKVFRRRDIAAVRIVPSDGDEPVVLKIAHIDLYFFYDLDVVILAVEVFGNDIPLDTAQDLLFRFGRAYPPYWESGVRGATCAARTEFLDAAGNVLATSDFGDRAKYLEFVCEHRAPLISSHWDFVMRPLVLHTSDEPGPLRYRQLEYYRMPYMLFLGFENTQHLSRADCIRLALGNRPGEENELPYSEAYLADFEQRYCYDRYFNTPGSGGVSGARFMASGNTLVVAGDAPDRFFMNENGGMLGRFRHQHFLMFLIAHFQKAALRMFSDRLVGIVSRLEVTDETANRIFRRDIRLVHEQFLRFAHRYWFHEISNQAQTLELFERMRSHLNLDAIYAEVREELQDMGNFLDVEAMRRQNETVVRLTVVTTFGLIGTVVTGFLGMNLFAFSEQPAWWRVLAFVVILAPAAILTLYTVMKSRRLSEFLDALADETMPWKGRWAALKRVWGGR